MDSITIIILSGLAFDIAMVLFIIFQVRRSGEKNRNQSVTRRQQMLEQGKIITAQEKLIKSKQDLLKEKEELLKLYRKING